MLRFSKILYFTPILFLIISQEILGQSNLDKDDHVLLPGDLVIRHEGREIGINRIPHIGIYVGDMTDFDVVHLEIEDKNREQVGIIKTARYLNEAHFKDPGFYSVMESRIPIEIHGVLTSFTELTDEQKNRIRDVVCEIAKKEIGRNFGKYFLGHEFSQTEHSQNCGDWVLEVYDRALRQEGITVMSHKNPLPGTYRWNLKAGELRDYAELFNRATDPSRLHGWLKEVKPPTVASEKKTIKRGYSDRRSKSESQAPPPPPPPPPGGGGGGAVVGGVDIDVVPESAGRLDPALRDQILKMRPSAEVLQRSVSTSGKEE